MPNTYEHCSVLHLNYLRKTELDCAPVNACGASGIFGITSIERKNVARTPTAPRDINAYAGFTTQRRAMTFTRPCRIDLFNMVSKSISGRSILDCVHVDDVIHPQVPGRDPARGKKYESGDHYHDPLPLVRERREMLLD